MCLVSVLCFTAGESFPWEGHRHYNYDLAQQECNRWNEKIHICESPKKRPSAASILFCKIYKAMNFEYKYHEIFFYKSRTNPRNLKYLILTSPFAVSKVKAAASKTFLLSPSNKMTSYLWNFLLFDNLAEVHLEITQHLLDTKHLKCFLYIYIHDFFLLFKEIFPFLKNLSLLPWGFAKDVSWL